MRPRAPHASLRCAADLDLTRDAFASSGLNHGLMMLGDGWTSAVLLGAFTGIQQFALWHQRLGIPRATLADRLRRLIALGLMRRCCDGGRPARQGYRLTRAGLQLYHHVLMFWLWQRRWGGRGPALPSELVHRSCGHAFTPVLACAACRAPAGMRDLKLALQVNPVLLERATRYARSSRLAREDRSGIGLRVDRWSLLIVNAVMLGCHHFDQLLHVLGISSSVLARRLAGMEDAGLLQAQPDAQDQRRRRYRLTAASRDLFGYLACLSNWAAQHLQQDASIRPRHKACGHEFVPAVLCSACRQSVHPWEVAFTPAHGACISSTPSRKPHVGRTDPSLGQQSRAQ